MGIHLYVDGGFDPDTEVCTKALVALHVDIDLNYSVVGSSGGVLSFDESSSLFLGGVRPSAYAAELYAQIMARTFVLQYWSDFKCVDICILYDSTSAADS